MSLLLLWERYKKAVAREVLIAFISCVLIAVFIIIGNVYNGYTNGVYTKWYAMYNLAFVVFIVFYPARILFYILKWAIKTVKAE